MGKFSGVPYPIQKDPKGYFRKQSDLNQIKSDLLILLLTNPGERCLTGGTSISLADGTEICISDLVGRDPFWVYSFDVNSKKIMPGRATAYKTIIDAELIEIVVDNDQKVRCTPNHLWLMRDGSYRRADELRPGDSLMPLYRNTNTSGYERVYQPSVLDYKETHRWFVGGDREKGVKEVVHHKDLNKRNNSPDNLQWMTCQAHKDLHKEISNAFIKKLNEEPKFREEWLEKVKNGLWEYYKTHDGSRKGAKLSAETKEKLSKKKKEYFETADGEAAKERLREAALKQFEIKGHPTLGRKHTDKDKEKMSKPRPSIAGDNNPSKRPEVREKLKLAWEKRRLKNHKVKLTRKLVEREDCYDLYVEKYHNFALSAGVFVHNCMLPEYGTDLRSLIFEQNDSILASKARDIIIASIRQWEPRVTIQQLDVFAGPDTASLSPNDDQSETAHILTIAINFLDPENIQEVQDLTLTVPLG